VFCSYRGINPRYINFISCIQKKLFSKLKNYFKKTKRVYSLFVNSFLYPIIIKGLIVIVLFLLLEHANWIHKLFNFLQNLNTRFINGCSRNQLGQVLRYFLSSFPISFFIQFFNLFPNSQFNFLFLYFYIRLHFSECVKEIEQKLL